MFTNGLLRRANGGHSDRREIYVRPTLLNKTTTELLRGITEEKQVIARKKRKVKHAHQLT